MDQAERLGSDDCHEASADSVSPSPYWINMSNAEYPTIVPVYVGRDPSVWNLFRSVISPEPPRDPSVWLPCGCVYDFDREESSISLGFLECHEMQSKIYNDLVGLIWFRPRNGQDRQTLFRVVPSETIPNADIQFGKNWLEDTWPGDIIDYSAAVASRVDDWENVRELVTLLYVTEDMKLWEVMQILEKDRGFRRTERQYKRMIAKWGLDTKNIRESDMKFVLARQQKRKLEEGKDTEFEINGRPVPTRKVQRFLRRKDISQQELQLSQDATPPYISYHTPFPTAEVGDESNKTDNKHPACNGDDVPSVASKEPSDDELSSSNISAASPFERWSQRYDLAGSPNWVRSYMTPRNPLSIISPAPIGTPWNDAHPEPRSNRSNVVSLIQESERDLMIFPKVHWIENAIEILKAERDGSKELDFYSGIGMNGGDLLSVGAANPFSAGEPASAIPFKASKLHLPRHPITEEASIAQNKDLEQCEPISENSIQRLA